MADIYKSRGFPAGVFVLDSANDTYWSGSLVAGTFHFTLDSPLTFQALNVVFQGEALVKWADTDTQRFGGYERTGDVTHRGRENYFQFVQTLAGGIALAPTTLSPGAHSFNFAYQMPASIPTSFEHKLGSIRYLVTASLDFGSLGPRRPDMDVVKMFTVVTPYDLNLDPDAREPINFEFEETPGGCFFCDSSPLSVKVSLPRTGYCPAQTIPIDIVADNSSSVEIQRIYLYLMKKVEFHSQEPHLSTQVEETLSRVKRGPVPCSAKRSLRVELEVPSELCMNLDKCTIIDISYFVRVEITLSGCNEDCTDDADLIIGVIPFADYQDAGYRHPLQHQLPALPPPRPETTTTVAYPSNTPYPTPAQHYIGGGYPHASPHPSPVGFIVGDHPAPPPPYPGFTPAQFPGYPRVHNVPPPLPAAMPYPPASLLAPAPDNPLLNSSKSDPSPGVPSAPPCN